MVESEYTESLFGRSFQVARPHAYTAYMPNPLQRTLEISQDNTSLLGGAEAALGRLAGVGPFLPEPDLLVVPYLRREALSSTRIEGTQATLLRSA